uniref:Lipid droplet-associated hydrolase n=1 Tax=Sinocyclocheilus rhinocerous TaxID=307959 RepID=A0A673I3L2_9TELE
MHLRVISSQRHTTIVVKESACKAVAHRYSLERESEFPVTTQSAHCSALKAAGYQRCHLSPYLPSLAVNLICEHFHLSTGNPGVVGFYKTYMWTLYQTFIRRYPVWAVSHAGHCMPPETYDMIEDASVTEKEDVFGLNGQIEHKLAFLRKHVPRDTNLLLIGHSIGCYIILEMMKRDPELLELDKKAVMLFPTIERMACSPQGKVMTPVLCRLRYAFYLPIFLLSLFPERLKVSIVRLALRNFYAVDTSIIPATVSLINVECAANGMYMVSQEMRLVVERDNATVRQHLSKLIFYYGATDHWCPVQYYRDIRKDFPEGDIRLCERGIRHAFVLDAGEEMANMTAEWIFDD